jgi:hypothetical protein
MWAGFFSSGCFFGFTRRLPASDSLRLAQARREKRSVSPRLTRFLQPQEAKASRQRVRSFLGPFRDRRSSPEPRSPRLPPPRRVNLSAERWRRPQPRRRRLGTPRRPVHDGKLRSPTLRTLKLQNLPKTNEERGPDVAGQNLRPSAAPEDKPGTLLPTAPRASMPPSATFDKRRRAPRAPPPYE